MAKTNLLLHKFVVGYKSPMLLQDVLSPALIRLVADNPIKKLNNLIILLSTPTAQIPITKPPTSCCFPTSKVNQFLTTQQLINRNAYQIINKLYGQSGLSDIELGRALKVHEFDISNLRGCWNENVTSSQQKILIIVVQELLKIIRNILDYHNQH